MATALPETVEAALADLLEKQFKLGKSAAHVRRESDITTAMCTPMAEALVTAIETICQALQEVEDRKDGAYLERNRCVALIARMAIAAGYTAGIARTAIEGWSEDWHGCVYVDLPTGQASWHYHDSQAHLFAGLPSYTGAWDGHNTPEKYRRVAAAFSTPETPA